MTRLHKFLLGAGLSLTLSLGLMAAPPDSTKMAKTPAAAAKMTAQTPPGPGYVWANKNSKVFHREGTKYFGATKNGEFMKEADAVAAGYHEAGKPAAKAPKAAAAAAGKKM